MGTNEDDAEATAASDPWADLREEPKARTKGPKRRSRGQRPFLFLLAVVFLAITALLYWTAYSIIQGVPAEGADVSEARAILQVAVAAGVLALVGISVHAWRAQPHLRIETLLILISGGLFGYFLHVGTLETIQGRDDAMVFQYMAILLPGIALVSSLVLALTVAMSASKRGRRAWVRVVVMAIAVLVMLVPPVEFNNDPEQPSELADAAGFGIVVGRLLFGGTLVWMAARVRAPRPTWFILFFIPIAFLIAAYTMASSYGAVEAQRLADDIAAARAPAPGVLSIVVGVSVAAFLRQRARRGSGPPR